MYENKFQTENILEIRLTPSYSVGGYILTYFEIKIKMPPQEWI